MEVCSTAFQTICQQEIFLFKISGAWVNGSVGKSTHACIHTCTQRVAGTLKRALGWDAVPAEESRWIQSPRLSHLYPRLCLLFLKHECVSSKVLCMPFEVQVHDSKVEHKNVQMRMTKVLKEVNPYSAVRKHAILSGLLPEHSL